MLTVKDISELTSYCPRTVTNWIKKGLLTAAKLGGHHWRIEEEDYKKFKEESEEKNG